jgi:hypothetical protein
MAVQEMNTCEFESRLEKASNGFELNNEITYTYDELLNLYENEKKLRIEIENKFQQKSYETSKQVFFFNF